MSRYLEEWPKLVRRLQEGWVLRSDIRRTTRMYRGISTMLMKWAEGSGHIVERQNREESHRMLYRVRPAAEGEQAGTLVDQPHASQ